MAGFLREVNEGKEYTKTFTKRFKTSEIITET